MCIRDSCPRSFQLDQFLFLIEHSKTPAAEQLTAYELASKLSYFRWNTAPDDRSLELAASRRLHASLQTEVQRMVRDKRFSQFVAGYYDLGARIESGFEFVPVRHHSHQLGGLLSQAGILAGLSDGQESNPIKRGAWLACKIIAEPPDSPPPNVPELPDDTETERTLREKLEMHRN